MSRKKNNEPIIIPNVTLEAVAAEGNALAHVEGKVLFVPKCIPGDVVDVQLTRKRKSFMQGFVVKMIKPSPMRVEPFCPHYGICGGCTWQALPYDKQLEFKQQQVEDQLIRIGHLKLPTAPVVKSTPLPFQKGSPLPQNNESSDKKPYIMPIIGSAKTQYYRNKLEYTFSNKRWILDGEDVNTLSDIDRLSLGFHIPQMFSKVLDIKECKLQREPSNAIRLFVKAYAIEHNMSFFDIREHTGLLRNLIIRTSSNGELMTIIVAGACKNDHTATSPASDSSASAAVSATGNNQGKNNTQPPTLSSQEQSALEDLMTATCKKFPEITSMYYVLNDKGNDAIGDSPCIHFSGKEFITEEMEGINFRIGPKSFYQTNSGQAYKLYGVVREFADLKGDEVLYDLYTGTGTIALFLSRQVKKVVGIEYVEEAIADAKVNAASNGITNSAFYAGDMKDVLNAEFIRQNGHPQIIVLDPPRAGIHPSVAQVILDTAPEKIVYVSCNPASQARDLQILASKYEIVAVQPVDMFPHTQHVENVVSMRLKKESE